MKSAQLRFIGGVGALTLALACAQVIGCSGTDTSPGGQDGGGSGGGSSATSSGSGADHICSLDCPVAHRCCKGSCDGPEVPLPNNCCTCLADEVSTTTCPSGKCAQ